MTVSAGFLTAENAVVSASRPSHNELLDVIDGGRQPCLIAS